MSKDDSNHKGEPVAEASNSNAEPSTSGSGIIVDVDEKTAPQNIYEKIFDVANKLASTSLGQYAIEKVDGVLSVVEKTAKWSLPQQLDSENQNATADKGIPAPPLERPCSWLPFLTLIVALRVIRAGLSVGSILIGNEPVTPESLLYFLQTRRRKLRAIKYHGLRAIRMKHQNADERKKRGVVGKLSSIFGMVACRSGRRNSNTAIKYRTKKSKKNTSEKNQSNKKNVSINEITQKRPLDQSDDSSDFGFDTDESDVNEMLNKYANEKSDNEDPDYVPPAAKLDEDDSSTTSSEAEDDVTSDYELDKTNESSEIQKQQENINSNNSGDNEFETNGDEVKKEQFNLTPQEKFMEHNPDNLTSSAINPVMMSSNIAASQNGTNYASPESGNIESFYDPIEVEEIEGAFKGQDFVAKRTRANSVDDLFYSPIASPIANHLYLQQQSGTDEVKLSSSAEELHTVIKKENIENIDDSNDASDNHEKHNENNNQKVHKSFKHNNNNNTNTNNNRQSHYKYTKGKKLH